MASFVYRRLGSMILVLFLVSVGAFILFVEVPGGDPAVRIAGRNATPQNVQNIREQWGFDEPVYVQYADMMERFFVKGDLVSYTNQTNVREQIIKGIPVTFSLAVGAALIWLTIGTGVGILSAMWAGRSGDRLLTGLALIGFSVPVFWIGIELRYLLTEKNSLLPNGEYVPFFTNPLEWASHLLLPCFVLSLPFMGIYGRVLRTSVLEVINQDFVRTAKAKGLGGRAILLRHVLRNALIPMVSLFGLDFAFVLGGGTILVEQVFDLHGVGQYAAEAIGTLDLPAIMGVTLYAAVIIVVLNALVDVAYAWLDPRIRVA